MTVAPGATVTVPMARALIDQALAKDYACGVLGFRAALAGSQPISFEHAGKPAVLVECVSALAAREAILSRPDDGWLVLVTERPDEDLGAGLLAQVIGQRLRPPDVWQAVQQRFAATGVEALLTAATDSRGVAAGLLEATPPQGWPPVPAGVLTRDHAFGAAARRWLDLPDGPLDAHAVLGWTTRRNLSSLLAEFRALAGDATTDAVLGWIARGAGAQQPLIERFLAAGSLADLVPLGLVLDCLLADGSADARLVLARLEHRWGSAPTTALAGLAAAATQVATDALARRGDDASRLLARADELAREAQGEVLMIGSEVMRAGLVQRLRRLAGLLLRTPLTQLPEIEVAWQSVQDHRLQHNDQAVPAFQAAVRLLRWLEAEAIEPSPSDLPGLAHRQAATDAWVDAAVNDAAAGVEDRQLGAALEAVLELVGRVRDRHDREFAAALAAATAADLGVVDGRLDSPDDPVHLLEKLLPTVVFPLARKTPVLLLVLDGLSTAVATEVISDVAARSDIALSEALLPGHRRRGVALSVLPSVTECSRASLLCGTLTRGEQAAELSGYASMVAAHALGGTSLFHKKILESSRLGFAVSDAVRTAVDDVAGQRLVTCVLNTIDDALDRSDPAGTTWTADAVKHLVPVLQRAREAGRTVVITSDHGHIVERRLGRQRSYPGATSARYRPVVAPVADDEVEVSGERVLTDDHRAVLAVSERLRYGPLKAGYHGGAAPAEVVVPVVLLVPSGADETPGALARPQEPAWWLGPIGAIAVSVPVIETPQPDLFEQAVPAASRMGAQVTGSATWAQQRRLAGRVVVAESDVAALVDALLAAPHARLTSTQVCAVLGVPVTRGAMAVGQVAKLLNVEGYPVISVDPATGSVSLDMTLLAEQFGVSA